MRRALVACAVLSPMIAAAYACQSDTFTSGDAAPEGGTTQGDFCDAEALYLHQCGWDDAACTQANLKNCGTFYSTVTNGVATAFTNCINKGQLPCTGETSKILTSPCMTAELAGYTNGSSELANFAQDYCKRCAPQSANCAGPFVTDPSQPGYIASFYTDTIIKQMDDCEKKLDGGPVLAGDGSVDCLSQTYLCEYLAISQASPVSACSDQ